MHKITAYQYKVEGACEICGSVTIHPQREPSTPELRAGESSDIMGTSDDCRVSKNIRSSTTASYLASRGNDICSHIRIDEAIQIKSASVHEPAQLIEAIAIKE